MTDIDRYTARGADIKLICGDALKVIGMESGSVDAVVTSPPYNQTGRRLSKKPTGIHTDGAWFSKVGRIGYADDVPEPVYQAWLREVVAECLRVSRGLVWINHKIRYRDGAGIHPARFLPFPIWSEVIWARAGSMALNCRRFGPSHEVILGFGRPHYWDSESNRIMSVWKICQVQNRTDHPCPFPQAIPDRLIKASVPPGGTVLDPFIGSGTTGLSALSLGRDFIGIDLSPVYLKMAKQRITAACPDTGTMTTPTTTTTSAPTTTARTPTA